MRVLWLVVFVIALVYGLLNPRSSRRASKGNVTPAQVTNITARSDKQLPFPAGELFDKKTHFEFAIYYTAAAKTDPAAALQKLCEQRFTRLARLKDPSELEGAKLPAVMIRPVQIEKYRPPDLEALKYYARGLSDEQKNQLQKCKEVFVLDFVDNASSVLKTVRDASELTAALATETGGLIWDDETREVFTTEAWQKRRLERWTGDIPSVFDHVTQHFYQDGELCRIVTLGMKKFALPDVCVEDIPRSSARSIGSLINLACQTMLERGKLEQPGKLNVDVASLKNTFMREYLSATYLDKATGKASLLLGSVIPKEGDASNRLAEIGFSGGADLNDQQRQDAVISQVFGSRDQVSTITHDDELLRVSEQAKAEIAKLAPRFQQNIPQGESLLVKAPFRTSSGGNEWMWVEVVRWNGKAIEGILKNDPYSVPGLKAGARVKVNQDSLFDYLHTLKDGTEVGNETGKLLMKRGN
ncbi:MAG TPA: DUF2314 domain-containing protein [Planctomycetota bacterium]|nr:DUF2314 domain-containing protein [Planctomycetota bacterium]